MSRAPGQSGNTPIRFKGSSTARKRGGCQRAVLCREDTGFGSTPLATQAQQEPRWGGQADGFLRERPGDVRKRSRRRSRARGRGGAGAAPGQQIRPEPVRAGLRQLGRWKETTAAEDTACIRAGGTLRTGSRRTLGAGFRATSPRAVAAGSGRSRHAAAWSCL